MEEEANYQLDHFSLFALSSNFRSFRSFVGKLFKMFSYVSGIQNYESQILTFMLVKTRQFPTKCAE